MVRTLRSASSRFSRITSTDIGRQLGYKYRGATATISTISPAQRTMATTTKLTNGTAKRVAGTPTKRVALQGDIWTLVNDAAAASPVTPLVNMGQGFYGYNPPDFVIQAAKDSLDRVECNQYSPTRGRPRLKKAIADAYSPFFNREINPVTEVTICTGANEGVCAALMAFLEPGDECIVFEPYFDQYLNNIELCDGKIVYIPLTPPKDGDTRTSHASEWTFDYEVLKKAFTPRTRVLIVNSPHNPIGKVFSREELLSIAELCVQHQVVIISDEVYDRLYYTPFTRVANLSPEIADLTLTVGSGGKSFYSTGWRVGWLIGPERLITATAAGHTKLCYTSVSPLQEATAIALEQAEERGFWDQCIKDMTEKVARFGAVFDELGLAWTVPDGGYFVLGNLAKVRLPEDYEWPATVANKPRDFKLSHFLIMEFGVAAIPPSEFMTEGRAHLVEDYLRFAVCKPTEMLEAAKDRLRGLKKYIE